MKKIALLLLLATLSACDDYDTVESTLSSTSSDFESMQNDVNDILQNTIDLCQEIEDEELRDKIIENMERINTLVCEDEYSVNYQLEEELERIYDMEDDRDAIANRY